MTVPGNLSSPLLATAAGAGAAALTGPAVKSVRFNQPDGAKLARTPSSSSNRKTFTYSAWIKRAADSGTNFLFVAGSTDAHAIYMNGVGGSATLVVSRYVGSFTYYIETTAKFRDPAAWYHIVVAYDTTQSTASDRIKIYVNGVQVTDFSSSSYPAQNSEYEVNSTVEHRIGHSCDMYFTDVYFIDGSALAPTSFGAFDTNNVWQVAEYSGTYGTNGFHLLDFANESTVGDDSSGNNNDFTASNISTTEGIGNDVLFDSPKNGDPTSDTGAGGQLSANYATFNAIMYEESLSALSNGNLDVSPNSSGSYHTVDTTIPVSSGKWYWEVTINTASTTPFIGIRKVTGNKLSTFVGNTADSYAIGGGNKWNNGINVTYGGSTGAGVVIGVALDLDNGTLKFYNNGTDQGTAYTGLSGTFVPAMSEGGGGNITLSINFGQRAFENNAPANHKCINTANLPTPAVADGLDGFETKLWTGNGSARTISGFSMQPDLVWMKNRSFGTNYELYDRQRGVEEVLKSDSADAEAADANGLTAFGSTSFNIGNHNPINRNNDSIVGWVWNAGTASSNSNGTVTSSVRANQTTGFSIVTWTSSNETAHSWGHGLGAAPQMVILKRRDAGTPWLVGHESVGWTKKMNLDSTGAAVANAAYWQNTAPTSTVVYSGTSSRIGGNNVAYCFTAIEGYSNYGAYNGTGSSTNPPFQYCGFRPAWILIKSDSSSEDWVIYDTARGPENVVDNVLRPNRDNIEATADERKIDILSNGFKLRGIEGSINAAFKSYIWWAIAENPFQANGGLAR